jgi:hypothetical protein
MRTSRRRAKSGETNADLILRSIAKRCVSKDGSKARTRSHPSRRAYRRRRRRRYALLRMRALFASAARTCRAGSAAVTFSTDACMLTGSKRFSYPCTGAFGLAESLILRNGFRRSFLQQCNETRHRHWGGEQISLSQIAAHPEQRTKVVDMLNSLRNSKCLEAVRQVDGCLAERCVLGVARATLYEGHIKLEFRKRKIFQPGK